MNEYGIAATILITAGISTLMGHAIGYHRAELAMRKRLARIREQRIGV